MSGPVEPVDVRDATEPVDHDPLELKDGRRTSLPGVDVVRVLPTRGRRTVGPWCFVDCMLPPDVADPDPMEIGPHPHIGLSTVTYLMTGEAVHGDSLGTEQVIRPGQLNLMSAGHGIAHAELGLGTTLQGVQLWLAQPEETRHAKPAFQHLEVLPTVDLHTGEATLLIGEMADQVSDARMDAPTIGADLRLRRGRVRLELDPTFEHAVVPLDTPIRVGDQVVSFGQLGYLQPGADHVHIDADESGARLLVLGGEPFEKLLMWWNFVGRDAAELTQGWADWQAHDTDRFGVVASTLDRINAPTPPWVRASG